MLFLVFFQFGTLGIYHLNLAIQVLFDTVDIFQLLIKRRFFLGNGLLFLLDAIFVFPNFACTIQHIPLVLCF